MNEWERQQRVEEILRFLKIFIVLFVGLMIHFGLGPWRAYQE